MKVVFEKSLRGSRFAAVQELLASQGLQWDDGVECTVCLEEGGEVVATGSRYRNTLRCIAAAPDRQGEGLVSKVVTELVRDAVEMGQEHLFLFTKPANQGIFRDLGFCAVAETPEVVLLESRREGIRRFVASLERPEAVAGGIVGAIVANCNPVTNGHLHLIGAAAEECDYVHLFILSEDRSDFRVDERVEMVRRCVVHFPNVLVQPTSDYMVSSVTFPDYFHKDQADAAQVNCRLDLTIFARCIASPLGITRRYVGTEPMCPVTAAYNAQMKVFLPEYGIQVVEVPRLEQDGEMVSASRVRSLFRNGRMDEARRLVPTEIVPCLERMIKR